jgi:hypothetical protein
MHDASDLVALRLGEREYVGSHFGSHAGDEPLMTIRISEHFVAPGVDGEIATRTARS